MAGRRGQGNEGIFHVVFAIWCNARVFSTEGGGEDYLCSKENLVILPGKYPLRFEEKHPLMLWTGHRPAVGTAQITGRDGNCHRPRAMPQQTPS